MLKNKRVKKEKEAKHILKQLNNLSNSNNSSNCNNHTINNKNYTINPVANHSSNCITINTHKTYTPKQHKTNPNIFNNSQNNNLNNSQNNNLNNCQNNKNNDSNKHNKQSEQSNCSLLYILDKEIEYFTNLLNNKYDSIQSFYTKFNNYINQLKKEEFQKKITNRYAEHFFVATSQTRASHGIEWDNSRPHERRQTRRRSYYLHINSPRNNRLQQRSY